MGLSQSIKAIISYSDIQDISNTIFKKFNYDIDKMEKGEKKDEIIITVENEIYFRDKKLYIDYKNKKNKVADRRKREIQELKRKINILDVAN